MCCARQAPDGFCMAGGGADTLADLRQAKSQIWALVKSLRRAKSGGRQATCLLAGL